ncbi:MAG: STAS domain-containing protein [Candidatus Cloacimonetes bacterium]|nr:STAS domain-containing protein [Candidatus Cloacimonadota bacterium]MCF7813796.1 STAS domain-containing protein [Candidatus Cloacimonadota bacterium]MCF7868475.1 STAS domain-containing protein [Candidatus Cloacimonadota bacterium]
MEIKQEKRDDALVMSVIGRLDATTATELEGELIPVIQKDRTKIILDFTGLEYISSAGLRVLLLAMKTTKKVAGELIICNMEDHIKEIFDIAGFLPIFKITGTVEEALA